MEYIKGQKQINAKIMSLNYGKCHTKIRQVDSMETNGNGVVIQVLFCFAILVINLLKYFIILGYW